VRFQLRTLLGITAVVAVMLATMAKFPFAVSCVVSAVTFAYFIRFVIRNPRHRMPAATLIACMVLPYVWIIGYDELDRIIPTVFWMIAGFPAFLPGAIVSGFLGQRFAENLWPGMFLTAIELGLGIWLIRLGPKRTIAYLLFVITPVDCCMTTTSDPRIAKPPSRTADFLCVSESSISSC
jgi:hypothetical protein